MVIWASVYNQMHCEAPFLHTIRLHPTPLLGMKVDTEVAHTISSFWDRMVHFYAIESCRKVTYEVQAFLTLVVILILKGLKVWRRISNRIADHLSVPTLHVRSSPSPTTRLSSIMSLKMPILQYLG